MLFHDSVDELIMPDVVYEINAEVVNSTSILTRATHGLLS